MSKDNEIVNLFYDFCIYIVVDASVEMYSLNELYDKMIELLVVHQFLV